MQPIAVSTPACGNSVEQFHSADARIISTSVADATRKNGRNWSMFDEDILGLTRHIGDHHYRAYIGPPDEYDLVSAMSFSLLTACGLRQHHKLLDIGCGSLRLGRSADTLPQHRKLCWPGAQWLAD